MRAAGGARLGRDPEVGGAGVEVDDELLVVRADRDLARPEEVVLLVGERDAGTLREGRDERALVERLLSDILFEVDQVLTVLAVEMEGAVSSVPEYVSRGEEDVLLNAGELTGDLLGVEGAVLVLQRATLLEGNADAVRLRDGARRSDECEGNGKESGLAEHGGWSDETEGERANKSKNLGQMPGSAGDILMANRRAGGGFI